MSSFEEHADGRVFVRTPTATYIDTRANFSVDFGAALTDLPAGALERIYTPGLRHTLSGVDGVIGGGEMPWQFGDDAISACAALIAAQTARHVSAPVLPPIPNISRRQLLLALVAANMITSAEAIAAAQTGTVPLEVAAAFSTLSAGDQLSATITWASMSSAERGNPLVALLASAKGMTSAQVDDFFRNAATL